MPLASWGQPSHIYQIRPFIHSSWAIERPAVQCQAPLLKIARRLFIDQLVVKPWAFMQSRAVVGSTSPSTGCRQKSSITSRAEGCMESVEDLQSRHRLTGNTRTIEAIGGIGACGVPDRMVTASHFHVQSSLCYRA